MNSKDKYLKYKNKYLELKKQIGGNLGMIENLSGPTSIDYYINPTINKRIIVLGDIHNSMEGVCDVDANTMDIVDYFEELIKTDINLDFFIEKDIPDKYQLYYGLKIDKLMGDYSIDFMKKVWKFSFNNYKKNPTKKLHFTDNRNKLLGHETFMSFGTIFELLQKINSFNEDINLKDFFYEYNKVLIENLFIFGKLLRKIQLLKLEDIIIEEPDEKYLPENLIKEIKKSTPAVLNKVSSVIKKYYEGFFDMLFDESLVINLTNLRYLDILYSRGQLLEAVVSDLYTILRIMKDDDIQNCILYVGQAHGQIMHDYLTELGFNLVRHNVSEETQYRCIKNIIPFHSFFNK